MHYPVLDDWHDYLRLINFLICLVSVYLLNRRFAVNGHTWNVKTRDYWFALAMWCVAGMALSVEGIYRDSPAGPRLVFIFLASAVTCKGLLRKGDWGGNDKS